MAVSGSGQVRYAVNGQVRIAFEDLGGAGGDPLLLIMGLAVSRFWWPDEDMTDDAVAVLDALGWDSAHLFGHYLPPEAYPQVAGEVRAVADRAFTAPSRASTA